MTMSYGATSALVKPDRGARLWLFDFDNTIAHLEPEVDWAAGRRELEGFLRGAGVTDEIFAEIPKGNLPLYEALRGRLSDSAKLPTLSPDKAVIEAWGANGEILLRDASSIIERHELAGIDRAEPTPGAIELFEGSVSRGGTIAIVTSNSSRTVCHWLEHHHASQSVGTIVGRDSLLALKPSPAMVFEALRQCGAHLQKAVFVGDSEADLGAARAAGIGFYGIATSNARRDRLSAAGVNEIFDSPAALSMHLNLAGIPSPGR